MRSSISFWFLCFIYELFFSFNTFYSLLESFLIRDSSLIMRNFNYFLFVWQLPPLCFLSSPWSCHKISYMYVRTYWADLEFCFLISLKGRLHPDFRFEEDPYCSPTIINKTYHHICSPRKLFLYSSENKAWVRGPTLVCVGLPCLLYTVTAKLWAQTHHGQ